MWNAELRNASETDPSVPGAHNHQTRSKGPDLSVLVMQIRQSSFATGSSIVWLVSFVQTSWEPVLDNQHYLANDPYLDPGKQRNDPGGVTSNRHMRCVTLGSKYKHYPN